MNPVIIDTFHSAVHLSGDILCDLLGANDGTTPDFICSAFAFEEDCRDEEYLQFENTHYWYHHHGGKWTRTEFARGLATGVGKMVLDATGNGKLDLIVGEWDHPYIRGDVSGGGNVYLLEQPENPFVGNWPIHRIATGHKDLHDVLCGDIDGDGKPEVLLRNKHHHISWIKPRANSREPWEEHRIAGQHSGDGTAIFDISGNGHLEVVTGNGFFKNTMGNGREWEFRSFEIEDLELHPERRVAVADLVGDGSVSVVITESEVSNYARVVVLTTRDNGRTWNRRILVDKDEEFRALHTLQLHDFSGNGRPDIYTAEMEHMETFTPERMPRWYILENKGNLEFEKRVILDSGLGIHHARLGRIEKGGPVCIIGNSYKRHKDNACGGRNHITLACP